MSLQNKYKALFIFKCCRTRESGDQKGAASVPAASDRLRHPAVLQCFVALGRQTILSISAHFFFPACWLLLSHPCCRTSQLHICQHCSLCTTFSFLLGRDLDLGLLHLFQPKLNWFLKHCCCALGFPYFKKGAKMTLNLFCCFFWMYSCVPPLSGWNSESRPVSLAGSHSLFSFPQQHFFLVISIVRLSPSLFHPF